MEFGKVKIECYGHDSVGIFTEKIAIYIDPYVLPKEPRKADIILISHDHYDHLSIEKINKVKKADTIYITNEVCCSKLNGDVRTAHVGEEIEVNEVKISGVEAYNINKPFHPKGRGIGFIVEIEEKRIYFAGDTDLIEEMKEIKNIDLALLPISGTYVMTIDEAIEAVKTIKPKIAVPMHYNVIDDTNSNPEEFKNKLKGICEVQILYK